MGKSEGLLAVLENKKGVRRGGLTAADFWPFDKPLGKLGVSSGPFRRLSRMSRPGGLESLGFARDLEYVERQEKGTIDSSMSTLFASKWLPGIRLGGLSQLSYVNRLGLDFLMAPRVRPSS